MARRTKIVATIGPASDSPGVLRALVDAGMDVARLGLAHGTVDDHVRRLRLIRQAAHDCGRAVGVLADLPGPKIRAGAFPEGGVVMVEGSRVAFAPGDGDSDTLVVQVDYPDLLEDVKAGDWITLGDGALLTEVEDVTGTQIVSVVRNGGRVQGSPGVHLPADRLRLSAPTAEDLILLEMAVAHDVDHVAASFVRSAEDVREVRDAAGPAPLVMAKIETPAAVRNLPAIIDCADAVMVARGDLGVELALEEVPHLQKRIIRTCVEFGRPVVTATQMLESMVHASTPTRAEASDVANAVFDGTDALMLSAETAIGHDPVAAVATMARIAERAERDADYIGWGRRLGRIQRLDDLPARVAIGGAITEAAWRAALSIDAAAIICATRTGGTVRAMARFRPTTPLYGLTPNHRTARQLTLTWGVEPCVVPEHHSTDEIVWLAVETLVHHGRVRQGDHVVVLAGSPTDPDPATDVLRIVRVR